MTPPPFISSSLTNDQSHYAYFDIAHHAMPIINQDKFLSELNKAVIAPHVASLSYAMATLGASLMDGYAHIKDKCYQLARKHLEVCEREEDGADLMTIEALQACILITNYELRGKGFARAWMTLGKCTSCSQHSVNMSAFADNDFKAERSGLLR